ncbi:hypothetical protein B0H17DRAFT_1210747 [Mycena rosella]|uniref:Uncharacterized protein n=1 Tax=Mycena rosella TaxID=1033263 RepID=A0AAD7CVM2_MYCRO|nr:hypothetical protein B0H17DRAFT_1210747 [Mycena rosella]
MSRRRRTGGRLGAVLVTFKRSFPARFPTQYYTQYYTGKWDAATDTLISTVGPDEDPTTQFSVFVFKRIMPEHMCFWPAPVEPDEQGARWWSFFNERRDNRKRFIKLHIRSSGSTKFGTPLNDAELLELALIRATVEHNAFCDARAVNLCTTPDCLTQRVIWDDMQKAHLPHHDLMKVRRVVHTRQFGKTYRDAKGALKHADVLRRRDG